MDWFDPTCPKLIAGIGTYLDEQALSRSFIIELRRTTEEEQNKLTDVAFFDPKAPRIIELRRKMLRWGNDNAQEYRRLSREIMLEMPKSIQARDKQKFSPLFAIAKLAGGDWPKLLSQAAFLSLNRTASHANVRLEHQLLCDCYQVVTARRDLLVAGAKDNLLSLQTFCCKDCMEFRRPHGQQCLSPANR